MDLISLKYTVIYIFIFEIISNWNFGNKTTPLENITDLWIQFSYKDIFFIKNQTKKKSLYFCCKYDLWSFYSEQKLQSKTVYTKLVRHKNLSLMSLTMIPV